MNHFIKHSFLSPTNKNHLRTAIPNDVITFKVPTGTKQVTLVHRRNIQGIYFVLKYLIRHLILLSTNNNYLLSPVSSNVVTFKLSTKDMQSTWVHRLLFLTAVSYGITLSTILLYDLRRRFIYILQYQLMS